MTTAKRLRQPPGAGPVAAAAPMNWMQWPTESLLGRLGTTADGLKSTDAEARLARFGSNDVGARHRRCGLGEFRTFLVNPLVIILLLASAASAIPGESV